MEYLQITIMTHLDVFFLANSIQINMIPIDKLEAVDLQCGPRSSTISHGATSSGHTK